VAYNLNEVTGVYNLLEMCVLTGFYFGLNCMDDIKSLLQVQAGRPPGNKDVIYDDQGNVLSVTKLDPSKLPSHL
jgi:hypothetical protein